MSVISLNWPFKLSHETHTYARVFDLFLRLIGKSLQRINSNWSFHNTLMQLILWKHKIMLPWWAERT